MSSEEEIEKTTGNELESFRETEKSTRISYTRDFLISLSELDVCKKLPSGFDQSLLSEFEDGYHGPPQDRIRNPGLPLPSHRRTDYSSSPPTRGDTSNYSRGTYGRWDNRSSVRSDRDSDSQSDKDSDSGRPQGNQTRKPWQIGEHDGLLGSGSFARPPGFAGSKGRSNDQYQLKKSNEPYHPPRPYKAGPISRREMTDSLNDETFGSSECGSQDRAEEERRRRESFELMRKEQHKSLQEKQNLTTDKLKKDNTANIGELGGESDDGNKAFAKNDNLDELMPNSLSNNDSSKHSLQTTVVRPLVPPGFVPPGFQTTVAEKNSSTAPLARLRAPEAERPDVEESILHAKDTVQNGLFNNQDGRLLINSASEKKNEVKQNLLDSKTQGLGETVKGNTKKVRGHSLIDPSVQAQQPSILDKLFNSVISDNLGGSSGLVEKQEPKQDDPWNPPNVIQSSKFAQWFSGDEVKGTKDLSHTRPNDLASLFGGGEKGESQASDIKIEFIPSSVELPKKLYNSSKEETLPPVLTCEDLEQTILSGYSGSSSASQKPLQGQNVFGPEEPKAETNNGASQHLLSLLQKGPVLKDTIRSSIVESGFPEKKVEKVAQSGNSLTLETLFGSAFMKELQSAEAPVSALGSTVKSNVNGQSGNSVSCFGNNNTQVGSDLSKQQSDLLSKRDGFDGANDIRLPEEESLIGVGDPVFSPFGNVIDRESQSSNRPISISDKLAPLSSGPYGSLDHEIPFHNLQDPSFSTRFHNGPQMNHVRQPFYPSDSHPTRANPTMNFNAQEGMIQHGLPNHMMRPPFRHPSGGQAAGFDLPHLMLQQMHMQRQTPNTITHHRQDFNRGAPMPPHLRTRAGGPMQEHNHMQGFPFDQQQANFGGSGMPMQAPEVRGNHPEAFQRLLEMELRANSSKHVMHPFDTQSGIHGHDLDPNFRYR